MDQPLDAAGTANPAAPLVRTLLLVGDFWNVEILQSIFLGLRRFQELRDDLKISDPVLSSRLAYLVDEGVLEGSPYQERPVRYEYLLTDAGKDLWRVLVELWAWDRTWVAKPHRLMGVDLRHLPCNSTIMPILGCQNCGAIGVTARDVSARADDPALADISQRRGRRSRVASETLSATSLLGDRWSILVLSQALMGVHHFGQFRSTLGISPVTLNARLTSFVERGVMVRVSMNEGAKRHVYRLTPMGRDFFSVISMINSWAQDWLAPDGTSGLSLRHHGCGQELRPQLTCNSCNRPLQRDQVRFEGRRRVAPFLT